MTTFLITVIILCARTFGILDFFKWVFVPVKTNTAAKLISFSFLSL